MTDCITPDQADAPTATPPVSPTGRTGFFMRGAIAGWVATAFTTNDLCWASFWAGIVGGALAYLLDALVWARVTREWRRRPRARSAFAVLAGLSMALFFRLGSGSAFEEVFGVPPPPGVTKLRVEAGSGWMDPVIFLQFQVDETTLGELMPGSGWIRDTETLEDWERIASFGRARSWQEKWERVFSSCLYCAGRSWQEVAPMTSPEIYDRPPSGSFKEWVKILWDPDTGRAYVVKMWF